MALLNRADTLVFINTSATPTTPTWGRVGKTDTADIALNPQTETKGYIEYPEDQTILKTYQPSLPITYACEEGDKAFDFLYTKYKKLDASDSTIGVLVCFAGSEAKDAWLLEEAQIVFNTHSISASTLEFTLNFNGTRQVGTYTVAAGVPTFVPASGGGE